jgi:hypothetical protein
MTQFTRGQPFAQRHGDVCCRDAIVAGTIVKRRLHLLGKLVRADADELDRYERRRDKHQHRERLPWQIAPPREHRSRLAPRFRAASIRNDLGQRIPPRNTRDG